MVTGVAVVSTSILKFYSLIFLLKHYFSFVYKIIKLIFISIESAHCLYSFETYVCILSIYRRAPTPTKHISPLPYREGGDVLVLQQKAEEGKPFPMM